MDGLHTIAVSARVRHFLWKRYVGARANAAMPLPNSSAMSPKPLCGLAAVTFGDASSGRGAATTVSLRRLPLTLGATDTVGPELRGAG
jgi:hypothetical protein